MIVAWDYAAANVVDNAFHDLIADFQDEMVVVTDMQFHAQVGDPANMKPCKRGTWNGRMVVETILSLLTRVCQCKRLHHRTWPGFHARIAFTMALFNLLVQWDGLPIDADGNIRLSIAEFSL